ncbi:MAG TPA: hypothetical protein VHI98_12960 [Vicinamibacterales bacterium]|jgi:hypothetical protein|nr:hypothetical protein [Vicinamibacterales bacterium]
MKATSVIWLAIAVVPAMIMRVQSDPHRAPTLEDVLIRAAEYVLRFERVIPSVVAEEHYRQRLLFIQPPAPGSRGSRPADDAQRTELKSDFLMVRSQDTDMWIPFRDVFEVDGKPVRAREERLTKLLMDASGSSHDRAWRLTEEGARYNIGPVQRTVNVPTQALQFLLPSNQPKSVFRRAGVDRVGHVPVWEVRFEEIGLPTLIRTTGGASLPATGTFWIDPTTGAVLRSMIRTKQPSFRSEIVVTFETHDAVNVRLPAELKEKYEGNGYELDGTATYSRFRKFRVTTDEVVK